MELNGFSILMFVFAFLVILAGIYIYTGHNSELLIWKGHKKNATKEELKVTGKWTIISGCIILIIGIIGMFLDI